MNLVLRGEVLLRKSRLITTNPVPKPALLTILYQHHLLLLTTSYQKFISILSFLSFPITQSRLQERFCTKVPSPNIRFFLLSIQNIRIAHCIFCSNVYVQLIVDLLDFLQTYCTLYSNFILNFSLISDTSNCQF